LGIETRAYRHKTIDDLEGAIASAVHDGIDGIYLSGEPLLINNLSRVLPLIMEAGNRAWVHTSNGHARAC
jgi:putative tryptophan/tyrosine transport system substrate-binding protein